MNILITGASSGIGRGLAGILSAQGHEVWGIGRSPSVQLDQDPGGAPWHYSACDVSDWHQISGLREEIVQMWGEVGAVICAAGIQAPIGPAMECDPEVWSKNLRINLDGVFFTIRAFHDLVKAPPGTHAKVLCFSGGGAASPRPNFTAYACAKSAVVRLVENLSLEWTGRPIDINAIAPGAVPTAMTQEIIRCGEGQAGATELANARKVIEMGGQAMTKVAKLVQYLLSRDSDGVSGRLISAPWDPWSKFGAHKETLAGSDVLTLRRIVPTDRGWDW